MSSWKNRLPSRASRLLQGSIALFALLLLLGVSPAAWAGYWTVKYECEARGSYSGGSWTWPKNPAISDGTLYVSHGNVGSYPDYYGYVHFRTDDYFGVGDSYANTKVTVTPVLTWNGTDPAPKQVVAVADINQGAYSPDGPWHTHNASISNSWGDAPTLDDDGQAQWLDNAKHVLTAANPNQEKTVRLPSFWMEAQFRDPDGFNYSAAECWFKVTPEPLSVYADLGNRFLSLSPDSTESDKVYDGIVKIGYKDDGNQENAPIEFWSGSASYSAFTSAFGAGKQYSWTAQGAPLFVYPYPGVEDLIETSTYRKNLNFDLGPVSRDSLRQFPRSTLVTVRVSGTNPGDPVLPGKMTVRWYPRIKFLSLPGDEPEDWDPSEEQLNEYLQRRRMVIAAGALLTREAYRFMYGELPSNLMGDSLLKSVEIFKDLRRAARSAQDPEAIGALRWLVRQKTGFKPTTPIPVVLDDGVEAMQVAPNLRAIGDFSEVKAMGELPWGGQVPAGAGPDVAETIGARFFSRDEIVAAGRNPSTGAFDPQEAALNLGVRFEDEALSTGRAMPGAPGKQMNNVTLGLGKDEVTNEPLLRPFTEDFIDGRAYDPFGGERPAFGSSVTDFYQACADTNNIIHFNVTAGRGKVIDVAEAVKKGGQPNASQIVGNRTNWELWVIQQHPEWWDRFRWWYKDDDGYRLLPNPFKDPKLFLHVSRYFAQ